MCDAGRIKHHLKHNLWRQESTVLFVGYQAVGTLGRALIGGAKEVKLFQEEVHVNAHIIQFPGMSGHADQEGLLKWAGSLRAKPDRVFVTHGEDKVTEIFAEKLWDEFRYPAMAPFSGTVFDLKENEFIGKNRWHSDPEGNNGKRWNTAHEKQRKCRLRSSRCGWSAAAHRHYKKQRWC